MLRIRVIAAVLGAVSAGLAVATIAGATAVEDDGAPASYEYTFGAGTFGPACWQTHGGPFCAPFSYTFRLLGVGTGSAPPWGVFERRNHTTGGILRGRVTCMTVEGNRAAIGGVFQTTSALPGDPFIVYVEDNGPLGSPVGDRISALAALPEGDPDRPLMPERFPSECPSADSIYGYTHLTSGEITVSSR